MKQQLLVDMDGVLADVYGRFMELEFAETNCRRSLESLNGLDEEAAFPLFRKHIVSPGFFRNAPLMDGSVEGLAYLNEKYKVLIVSSATEFPESPNEKLAWINEHFPFLSWRQLIFCGDKSHIKGDIMIDDHPKNLDFFDGRRILFTQPHNITIQRDDYQRVNNWKDIYSLL